MRRIPAVIALLAAVTVAALGCSFIEEAPDKPRPNRVSFTLDSPRIMAGTVASEAVMLNYQPVVVHGWGLVVGLNGTGSRDIPPAVRAHMVQEMARRGIGSESAGYGHLKPEAMLNSPDTAVVIVEGVIPPGAVGRQVTALNHINGTIFDVRVTADPSSGTTSLEGGRLYTCELRPAIPGQRMPPVGSKQAKAIAEARGPIFVNPFAEPGAIERDTVDRNTGRIIGGGEALDDVPLKLRLATPSHARAQTIQNSINTRFPREPGQPDETAHGLSAELIRINVPVSHRGDPENFIELLRHTTIRLSGPERVANAVKRALLNDPSGAYAATWRWEALGPKALPIVKTLYDHPEELPRLAALRAGAHLEDPHATPHLIAMLESEDGDVRRQATVLLGSMHLDPRIDQALLLRLDDEDLDVRLAAYEALITRGNPYITRTAIGGKLVLDIVDSTYPMIYVSQIGEPRIAIFGRDPAITIPILAEIWSGRLLVQAEPDDEKVEVFYRTLDGRMTLTHRTDPQLESFVEFLGHETTIERPEPGLDLSYGETVGVLYHLWRKQYIEGDFRAQQDRVLAAIMKQRQSESDEGRAEFADPPEVESDLESIIPPAVGEDLGEE